MMEGEDLGCSQFGLGPFHVHTNCPTWALKPYTKPGKLARERTTLVSTVGRTTFVCLTQGKKKTKKEKTQKKEEKKKTEEENG